MAMKFNGWSVVAMAMALVARSADVRADDEGAQFDVTVQPAAVSTINAINAIDLLQTKHKLGMYKDGCNLYAGSFDINQQRSVGVELKAGVNYVFVATGDENCEDIDTCVTDSKGKFLKSEHEKRNFSLLEFSPTEDGVYRVAAELKATGSATRVAYLTLCCLQENGWNVPKNHLMAASARYFAVARRADQLLRAKGERIALTTADSTWSMIGSVMEQGDLRGVKGAKLSGGPRIFLAAADESGLDIDLAISNDQRESVDKDPDNTPMLRFTTDDSSLHTWKVMLSKSKGPSLVLSGCLAVVPVDTPNRDSKPAEFVLGRYTAQLNRHGHSGLTTN